MFRASPSAGGGTARPLAQPGKSRCKCLGLGVFRGSPMGRNDRWDHCSPLSTCSCRSVRGSVTGRDFCQAHTSGTFPRSQLSSPVPLEPIHRCEYPSGAAGAQDGERPPTGKKAGRHRLVRAGWASLRSVFGVAITFLQPRHAGWKLTSAHPEISSTPLLPQRATPGPAPTQTEPLPACLPKDLQGSGGRREIRSRALIAGAGGFQTPWQPARPHVMGPQVTSLARGPGQRRSHGLN